MLVGGLRCEGQVGALRACLDRGRYSEMATAGAHDYFGAGGPGAGSSPMRAKPTRMLAGSARLWLGEAMRACRCDRGDTNPTAGRGFGDGFVRG